MTRATLRHSVAPGIDAAARNCQLGAMRRSIAARRAAPAVWLRVLLVAAVVMSAFAHRAAVAAPQAPSPLELAFYAFPDGSVPDICDTDGGGEADHASHIVCDFCLIAGGSAPSTPATPDLARPIPVALGLTVALVAGPPVATVDLVTASKRGPPSVSA